jgi:hypothetical protein
MDIKMKNISYKRKEDNRALNIGCLILSIPAISLVLITVSYLGMFDYSIILKMIP